MNILSVKYGVKRGDIMTFQDNLKRYREMAGYSQAKEFAEKIGVPYQTYMGYENRGREPKFSTLVKIADALNMSIDKLLSHEAPRPANTLENAIQDVKECGFVVSISDDSPNGPIQIADKIESCIYTTNGEKLIELSAKINRLALSTYRDSKRQLYALAFDEARTKQEKR